ncbi:MAG: Thiamine-phosphate synthase [Lentisphaerae bacterium ADurb.Bin242]|nr:MAG: Thiamine-phosphate synthase [Lentisphaerae bacterium ADurb.Bin242]
MGEIRNNRMERLRKADLYPVITREFTAGRGTLRVLEEAADAGIRIVQLREKSVSDRELCSLAEKFRKICDRYGILMILNDHIDIAMVCGADGVHLGQDDLPLEYAVKLAPELLIGRSTHSRVQALEAQSLGAAYVNLGPLFPTQTKNTPVHPLGLEIIRETRPELHIPFSVMGGIKAHHIPTLLAEGARLIAMVTEVTQAPDIGKRVRELRALWQPT